MTFARKTLKIIVDWYTNITQCDCKQGSEVATAQVLANCKSHFRKRNLVNVGPEFRPVYIQLAAMEV